MHQSDSGKKVKSTKASRPEQINRIRILGKTWRLCRFTQSIDNESSGVTDHAKLNISVDANLPLELVQDTLWHELKHAIDEELNLGLTEAQIHTLATVELSVLKDNPLLARFLLRTK